MTTTVKRCRLLSRVQHRLACGARLGMFATAVLGGSLLFATHAAHAAMRRMLEDVGADAMRYANALHESTPHTLHVNGLSLRIAVDSTSDSLTQVLDHFHAECRAHGGHLAEPLARLPKASAYRELLRLPQLDGVLRTEHELDGYVACFYNGDAHLQPSDISERATAFLRDLDISHFGALRYVVAERHGDRTTYVTLWSEGTLPLRAAFPAHGDVPGFDLGIAPRPEDAERVISAWQEGAAPSINAYRSKRLTPKAFLERYQAQLEAAGYRVEEPAKRSTTEERPHRLAASRGGFSLAIIAASGRDGRGVLTLLPQL